MEISKENFGGKANLRLMKKIKQGRRERQVKIIEVLQ